MRNAIGFVLAAFLGAVTNVVVQDKPANSQGSAESTPTAVQAELRSLVDQYFAAYQNKDLETMMALWSVRSPTLASVRQETQEFFAENENIRVTKLTISEAVFEGPYKVRLRVSSETNATDVNTSMASTGLGHAVHFLDLAKESDKWKIWQDTDVAEQLADGLVGAASEDERTALLKKDREAVAPRLVKALILRGYKSRSNGAFPKAIETFSFAGKLAEEIGDEAGLSNSCRAVGMVYEMQGDHRQARDWLQKSVDIAQKLQHPRLIAVSLGYLGIAQERLGEYSSAKESYQKALEIAESVHEKQIAANALGNLGVLVKAQGNFAQAEKYFQKALPMYEELGDQARMATAQIELGGIEVFRNNYSLAMEYFQKALPHANNRSMWTALNGIGTVLESQGDYESALGYYRRSLEISEKLGSKEAIYWTLASLGTAETRQNNLDAALIDLRKGMEIAEEAGDKYASASLANEIGRAYIEHGDYKTALEWEKKSAALAAELGDKYLTGSALENLSVIHRNLGEFDLAIEAAERASGIGRTIGSRQMVADEATEAAKAYRAMGKTAQASKALQEAIDSIESIRFDIAGGEQQQQRFFEQQVNPYQEMADLLISQNQWKEAFILAERAKGRVLVDVLARGKLPPTKAMTEAERLGEQRIEAELASLNDQLQQAEGDAKSDKKRVDSLKARLDQTRLRFEEFQIALYAAHPELKAERGQVSPITLDQTADLVPDNRSALLEFMVGESQGYLFVITRASRSATPQLHVYPLHTNAHKLAKKAEEFRAMLALRSPDFHSLGKQLYQLLLAPAQKQLADKDMLIMVPDGPLWSLPFQALVQDDGRYLVEQYAIAYAPSLTVLREMERVRKDIEPTMEALHGPKLLAMADPALGQTTLAHANFAYRGEKLAPLPDARREVLALKRFYPGPESAIYLGEEAREDRFKAEAGKFRILHLASHAVLDNASPMYSNVLLSPGDSGHEDGLLEAREIMQMDLHANLVVLSACETARGHIAPGEGVIGLTWAFFLAGAPTMVVSQWRVESASTAALMLSFYSFLNTPNARGLPEISVAKAMQKAEIQTLRKPGYAHPFYWAGFVVTGDPGVVATR
jgi:CHAT domain-containing protein/Tfp pilus assembly protein PilF